MRPAAQRPASGGALEWVFLAISALVALGGVAFAYWAFVVNTEIPRRVRASLGWVFTLVENKYYVDEVYNAVFVQPAWDLGRWFSSIVDQRGIDGAVNGVASLTGWVGVQARKLQTGLLGLYALSILFGVVALLVWFVVR